LPHAASLPPHRTRARYARVRALRRTYLPPTAFRDAAPAQRAGDARLMRAMARIIAAAPVERRSVVPCHEFFTAMSEYSADAAPRCLMIAAPLFDSHFAYAMMPQPPKRRFASLRRHAA